MIVGSPMLAIGGSAEGRVDVVRNKVSLLLWTQETHQSSRRRLALTCLPNGCQPHM